MAIFWFVGKITRIHFQFSGEKLSTKTWRCNTSYENHLTLSQTCKTHADMRWNMFTNNSPTFFSNLTQLWGHKHQPFSPEKNHGSHGRSCSGWTPVTALRWWSAWRMEKDDDERGLMGPWGMGSAMGWKGSHPRLWWWCLDDWMMELVKFECCSYRWMLRWLNFAGWWMSLEKL